MLFALLDELETCLSTPVPWNCIVPQANCEAERAFAPRNQTAVVEKAGQFAAVHAYPLEDLPAGAQESE
jgi:hypothetical protein